MAQGSLKLSKTKVSKPKAKKSKSSTKGPTIAKPRKGPALKDAKIKHQHTASLTASTEKLIASRVGHLELLKGTRREIEKNNANNNNKGVKK